MSQALAVDLYGAGMALAGRPADALAGLRFTGDVWGGAGRPGMFAGEPLLEVTAPLPQAQLVETYLLNQVNLATTLTPNAVR